MVEYLRAFLTASVANTLMLISGAFGLFHLANLAEIRGYRHDIVGEDLELVVHLHRHLREKKAPLPPSFIPDIVCSTEAPAALKGLDNQRALAAR